MESWKRVENEFLFAIGSENDQNKKLRNTPLTTQLVISLSKKIMHHTEYRLNMIYRSQKCLQIGKKNIILITNRKVRKKIEG